MSEMRYIEVDPERAHYVITLVEDDLVDPVDVSELDVWLTDHQLDPTLAIWLSRQLNPSVHGESVVARIRPADESAHGDDLSRVSRVIAVAPDSDVKERNPIWA